MCVMASRHEEPITWPVLPTDIRRRGAVRIRKIDGKELVVGFCRFKFSRFKGLGQQNTKIKVRRYVGPIRLCSNMLRMKFLKKCFDLVLYMYFEVNYKSKQENQSLYIHDTYQIMLYYVRLEFVRNCFDLVLYEYLEVSYKLQKFPHVSSWYRGPYIIL